MKNIGKYIRQIYFTMSLGTPVFVVIIFFLQRADNRYPPETQDLFYIYIFLTIGMLIVGGLFALGMYVILRLTKGIREVYVRKLILNVVGVFGIIIPFMALASDTSGSNYYEFMEFLPPYIFTFIMSIWYFELEPVI